MGVLSPSDWTSAMSSDPTGSKEAAAMQFIAQQNALNYQKETMAPFVESGKANIQRLNELMGAGQYLEPTRTFTTADWGASPEYAAYNAAQQAAQTNSLAALQAQAGASGMYGGGTYANQLSQNLGNLYAQYQPASLAAAQQNWNANRALAYNMLAGLANPTAAQQVGAWAGNAAANVGNAFGQSAMNTAAARQQGLSNLGSSAIDLLKGQFMGNNYDTYGMDASLNNIDFMIANPGANWSMGAPLDTNVFSGASGFSTADLPTFAEYTG